MQGLGNELPADAVGAVQRDPTRLERTDDGGTAHGRKEALWEIAEGEETRGQGDGAGRRGRRGTRQEKGEKEMLVVRPH